MSCTRKQIVDQARSWLGLKESDGSFKVIIDTYNGHKPLARGYKLKYTDEWCAGFASACAIACGATDIIPTEVGCGKHIKLFQKMNIWVEADDHVPSPGDYIFYDWKDDGKGENTDGASHVGIVEEVKDGKITVIEGNYSQSVKRRTIQVNGKYIRGFGVPKYDEEKVEKPATTSTPSVEPKESAKKFDKAVAGTYAVTAENALNVRYGAGTSKAVMVVIPNGWKVKCYGYYTSVLGTKWLKVQFTYKGTKYTGFSSSKYLKKQ